MKITDYRSAFIRELSAIYDEQEIESFFYLILEDLRNLRRVDLAINPELSFTEPEVGEWNAILGKLKQEIPIQYILGKAHFFGLELEVSRSVLIPRPETEELVDWIIKDHQDIKQPLAILDIGTGSGCIAVALAKNLPRAKVSAIDVSEDALDVARRNGELNSVAVEFTIKDILKSDIDGKFDIIVSNPPYVRNIEKHEIKRNVLDHEPHLALFVDDEDPLLFYKRIALLAKEALSENGKLYFEINQYLGNQMVELLEKDFRSVEIRKDIYCNDRMVRAF